MLKKKVAQGIYINMHNLIPQPRVDGNEDDGTDSKQNSTRKKRVVVTALDFMEMFNAGIAMALLDQPARLAQYHRLLGHTIRLMQDCRLEVGFAYFELMRSISGVREGTGPNGEPIMLHSNVDMGEYNPGAALRVQTEARPATGNTHAASSRGYGVTSSNNEACRKYNFATCTHGSACRYEHACSVCNGNHKAREVHPESIRPRHERTAATKPSKPVKQAKSA